MHVLFIHPNFPAQFGHIAAHLVTALGWQATFATSVDTSHRKVPFNHINYRLGPGPKPKAFYNPATLQELFEHMAALFEGMRSLPDCKPDLVVGHMSYGTMLYLRTLYDCPFIGYFEMLPGSFWNDDIVLRPEYPPPLEARLSAATYNTFTYLHLHHVDAAYTPTHYQLSLAPAELRHKIRVIFDGIDCDFFQRRAVPRPTEFHGRTIGPTTRVITYVSRGLEAMRGFDIFMKVAKKIYEQYDDVLFLIAGEERTNYGHELFHLPPGQTFKQHVLSRDNYKLEKFHFLGRIPPTDLVTLFSLSDLHIYLTCPYVLSWSMMQALATECVVLGSATEPVQEVIEPGVNGLLEDFYDVEGLARQALRVLGDPGQFRPLGAAARRHILEGGYEKQACVQQLVKYFEEVAAKRGKRGSNG